MISQECKKYLIERHQGEVYGEALFRSLAERATDDSRRHKLRVLERLERDTKRRIGSVLQRLGIDAVDDARSVQRGEADSQRFAGLDWNRLMQGFRVELEKFVSVFEQSESLAASQGEAQDLLRHITMHERALLNFATRELQGLDESSLESVLRILE
jgi:hypothetical protein